MSEVTGKGTDATQGGADETESRASGPVMRPAGDIFENGDGIVLLLDMPGVAAERLHIESDRNSLVVEGEIAIDVPTDTESLYADIRTTRYRRSFSLSGEQLDTAAVDAVLKDGVLRIAIPKRAETRPRRIEVRTG
jgi:HSP20 family molecular chaperone IbpA